MTFYSTHYMNSYTTRYMTSYTTRYMTSYTASYMTSYTSNYVTSYTTNYMISYYNALHEVHNKFISNEDPLTQMGCSEDCLLFNGQWNSNP